MLRSANRDRSHVHVHNARLSTGYLQVEPGWAI
jgi:hypothetical protein